MYLHSVIIKKNQIMKMKIQSSQNVKDPAAILEPVGVPPLYLALVRQGQ